MIPWRTSRPTCSAKKRVAVEHGVQLLNTGYARKESLKSVKGQSRLQVQMRSPRTHANISRLILCVYCLAFKVKSYSCGCYIPAFSFQDASAANEKPEDSWSFHPSLVLHSKFLRLSGRSEL